MHELVEIKQNIKLKIKINCIVLPTVIFPPVKNGCIRKRGS